MDGPLRAHPGPRAVVVIQYQLHRVPAQGSFCAARLQTVDQGAPVSTYTVAREMGHGGEALEYRVEQHAAKLGATPP